MHQGNQYDPGGLIAVALFHSSDHNQDARKASRYCFRRTNGVGVVSAV